MLSFERCTFSAHVAPPNLVGSEADCCSFRLELLQATAHKAVKDAHGSPQPPRGTRRCSRSPPQKPVPDRPRRPSPTHARPETKRYEGFRFNVRREDEKEHGRMYGDLFSFDAQGVLGAASHATRWTRGSLCVYLACFQGWLCGLPRRWENSLRAPHSKTFSETNKQNDEAATPTRSTLTHELASSNKRTNGGLHAVHATAGTKKRRDCFHPARGNPQQDTQQSVSISGSNCVPPPASRGQRFSKTCVQQ